MPPPTLNSEEPDLRDGCAALLVFRVGSTRTLMRKDAPQGWGRVGGHLTVEAHTP